MDPAAPAVPPDVHDPDEPPEVPPAPAPASAAAPKVAAPDDAKKLFEDGKTLFEKKQHREARALFTRCLEVDPDYARCHLMLGSTYARLGDVESGARHYRIFVKLAPNAPETPKLIGAAPPV